jgi:hypothetical protein
VPNRTALQFTDNPGDLPAQYVVPPSMDLQLQSVVARFNGSGAGAAFWPCLSVFTSDDHLVGRFRPSTQMEAGDSGVVTYAPFLKDDVSSGGCTVLTRVFNTKDNEDGGAGFLYTEAGDAAFVVDALSPTGEAVAFSGTYPDFATMIASPTSDAYVIEIFSMTQPAPYPATGPANKAYRFSIDLLVRGTDAATTYKLSASYGDNQIPSYAYVGRSGVSDPFVYDDAWKRDTTDGFYRSDASTRELKGTAYQHTHLDMGEQSPDASEPFHNVLVFITGWKTAGAGTVHLARATFSWIATDF